MSPLGLKMVQDLIDATRHRLHRNRERPTHRRQRRSADPRWRRRHPRRQDRLCRPGRAASAGAARRDGASTRAAARILPGLVEAHFHPTYFNVAALEDLDIKYPVEYVTLLAAAQREAGPRMRLHGGAIGGSLFNIDVWLKKAIENDICARARAWPPAAGKSAASAD